MKVFLKILMNIGRVRFSFSFFIGHLILLMKFGMVCSMYVDKHPRREVGTRIGHLLNGQSYLKRRNSHFSKNGISLRVLVEQLERQDKTGKVFSIFLMTNGTLFKS